jgi:hypothetical protein
MAFCDRLGWVEPNDSLQRFAKERFGLAESQIFCSAGPDYGEIQDNQANGCI